MKKRKSKWISVLLVLTIIITTLPNRTIPAYAADNWTGGYSTDWYVGHETDTGYSISTADELAGLAYLVNNGTDFNHKTIYLTKDIDLSGSIWTPIGINYNIYFSGTFDGRGNKITGLTIDFTYTKDYAGLFGYIDKNSMIKNLGLENVNISSDCYCVSGLVGCNNYGTITNCYVTGSVSISSSHLGGRVGGLVGHNYNGTVTNCYSTGSVSGTGNNLHTGGLMGYSQYSTIINCYSTSDVAETNTKAEVGGLAGGIHTCTVINCYATANVSASGTDVGGFTGYSYCSTITNCYFNNENINKIGDDRNFGTAVNLTGLSPEVMKGTSGTGISYNTSNGTATTSTANGAFIEALNGGISAIIGSVSAFQWVAGDSTNGGFPTISSIQSPEAKVYLGSEIGTTKIEATASESNHFAISFNSSAIPAPVAGNLIENAQSYNSGADISITDLSQSKYIALYELDSNNRAVKFCLFMLTADDIRTEADFKGYGTKAEPFQISTEENLKYLAEKVNGGITYEDQYLTITDNINVSGTWTPIGISYRNFDGNLDGAGHKITGITIGSSDSPVTPSDGVGLFGYIGSNATINNVGVDVSFYLSGDLLPIGGIAASNSGTITNCYATGTISSTVSSNDIGGLVGKNFGIITNCYATGTISSTGSYTNIGGLVGYASGLVKNCYSTNTITSTNTNTKIGGLVGHSYNGTYINCYYNNANLYDLGYSCNTIKNNLTGMSTDDMKKLTFAKILNTNTAGIDGAMSWLADTGKVNGAFPILTQLEVASSVMVNSACNATLICIGETLQFSTALLPETAVDKTILWSVSDEKLATIDDKGLLTAKAVGTVTVTATAASGACNTKQIVIESGEVTGVTLDREKMTMAVSGSAITLNATVLPEYALYRDVIWSSSNANIATVTDGIVTPVASGSANIMVTTVDGGKTTACEVTVVATGSAIISSLAATNKTVSIVLDKAPDTVPTTSDFSVACSINGGLPESLPLTNFTWNESTRTATLDFTSIAQTKTVQCVVISVSYKTSSVKAKEFKVEAAKVASITVNSEGTAENLLKGKTLQMSANILPKCVADTPVLWSVINNSGTAEINSEGLLTGTGAGTITVKATAGDGSGIYGTKTITIYVIPDYSPTDSSSDKPSADKPSADKPSADTPTPSSEDNKEKSVIHIELSEKETQTTDGKVIIPVPMEKLKKALSDPKATNVSISLEVSDGVLDNSGQISSLLLNAKVLEAVKSSGKSLSISIHGSDNKVLYTWTFDTKTFSSQNHELTDVNLNVKLITAADDSYINKILGEEVASDSLIFRFEQEGTLPSQVSVRIYVGDQQGFTKGKRIYFYHYNKNAGKLETLPFSSGYVVDEEGYVTVHLVHCSDYVALLKKADAENIISLREQISITPRKRILYVGEGKNKAVHIKIKLPKTLKLKNSLKDTTSNSYIGGVTATFSSGNKDVATVDKEGNITAVGVGKTKITTKLKLYSGKTKTVYTIITVKK